MTTELAGRPKVFLSSTVKDLADLRSAVKFWLEEYGFVVLASEWPDFPHALDREAVAAALTPIEQCDYYVLLLGMRAGAILPEGISVTRSEFRRARELHRSAGRPQMLHLVRAEVLSARRLGKPPELKEEEWAHITGLLEEVQTAGEPGDPNWVRSFSSFRDVVDALRATLRISGPLRRRALEANLIQEILENTRADLMRVKDRLMPTAWYLPDLKVTVEDTLEQTTVDSKTATRMFMFRIHVSRAGRARAALDEAINSGEFLEYDSSAGRFAVGAVQKALLDLRSATAQLDSVVGTIETDATMRDDLNRLTEAGRQRTDALVHGYTIAFFNAAEKAMLNAMDLRRALYRHLAGLDERLKAPDLRSAALGSREQERIEAETVTLADAKQWLRE